MKLQVTETMNIRAAHDALQQAVRMYLNKDSEGRYRMNRRRARPVCLMGPAGIGKTEIVQQVAQEMGLAFLSYSITHHTRQSLIGLPRLSVIEAEGKEYPVTEYTTSEIIADVLRTGKKEGILFLDEFNCASETLRPIMLQLLQDKSLGGHRLPDGWVLVLAGNPAEYNRAANEIDAVTADRLRMIFVEPDLAAWMEYAVKKGIHPVILSYLETHSGDFYRFEKDGSGAGIVTARGWEDLSLAIAQVEAFGEQVTLGLVAQYLQLSDVARSFFSYFTIYQEFIANKLVQRFQENRLSTAERRKVENLPMERKLALAAAVRAQIGQKAEAALEACRTADAIYKLLMLRRGGRNDLTGTENLEETMMNRCAGEWMKAHGDNPFDTVKDAFLKGPCAAKTEAVTAANDALTKTLLSAAEVFGDGPELEFFLLGLHEQESWVKVLSQQKNEVYHRLCSKTFFEDEPEISVEEMLKE